MMVECPMVVIRCRPSEEHDVQAIDLQRHCGVGEVACWALVRVSHFAFASAARGTLPAHHLEEGQPSPTTSSLGISEA